MNTPKNTARLAGVLYLLVAIFGLFVQEYALSAVYVPGEAAVTAHNIVEHAALVRLAVVADLAMAVSFIFLGMTFYTLFKHVNKDVAAALVTFVAIGTGMILVYLLSQFAALLVATDPSFATALGTDGSDALALLLMDMRTYGAASTGIPFGLWMLPIGYLAYASGMFPRPLGVVLMIGSFGYLINSLTVFLLPDLGSTTVRILTAPAGLAEFWLIGYLLLIGVRTTTTASRAALDPAKSPTPA
jgi:hypothetical protein